MNCKFNMKYLITSKLEGVMVARVVGQLAVSSRSGYKVTTRRNHLTGEVLIVLGTFQ